MNARFALTIALLFSQCFALGGTNTPQPCSWAGAWRINWEGQAGTVEFFYGPADCVGPYCNLFCRYTTADGRRIPCNIVSINERDVSFEIDFPPIQRFAGTLDGASCRITGVTTLRDRTVDFSATRSATTHRSLRWIPRSASIPANAIKVELAAGQNRYICRARHEGGQHPGELWSSKCYISWGGAEIASPDYEILTGSGDWRRSRDEIAGAFEGGAEPGRTLYVCRSSIRGRNHAGKVVSVRSHDIVD